MAGAVDLSECPYRPRECRCEQCAVCGWWKHMGIHGPYYGEEAGSTPWGHEFVRRHTDAEQGGED